MRTGVDIGGTFTDFVMQTDDGLRVHKLLSTPHDPARAMLDGLKTLAGTLDALRHVTHGSTVATNAILERNGARTAFITTEGFRDMLAIGRQNRPDLYALHPVLPAPLVARENCYEIGERLDHQGKVLIALDEAEVNMLAHRLAEQRYEAVAVCLLYSFVDGTHEKRIRQALVATGAYENWQIALSHEVLPEFREYERASTTVLEAYVRPKMVNYVRQLRAHLPTSTTLHLMKSDGGLLGATRIHEAAAHTVLSGPAAGVIGALHLAKLAGYERIITLDMGGTSTDVALCAGAVPLAAHQQIDGLPLRLPMLDIETIGAGGGSLARLDDGGLLRVGPQSAGADPGPIAYGRGGTQPTVTDANLLLGRLSASHFLGGKMALETAAVETALTTLGHAMSRDAQGAARGIVAVANAHIDRALRRVSVERGHDPRDFTLVAYGGAGPLHACEVAAALDIPLVLIPPHPGVLCALGLLVSDLRVNASLPVLQTATQHLISRVRAEQATLLKYGRDELRAEGVADADMRFEVTLDMRYHGQAHELSVKLAGNVIKAFHETHERTYGHALRDRAVEIVAMRLNASGTLPAPTFQPQPTHTCHPEPNTSDGIARYDRAGLRPGARLRGEAIITQGDATTYLPSGWEGYVDGFGNLLLGRG